MPISATLASMPMPSYANSLIDGGLAPIFDSPIVSRIRQSDPKKRQSDRRSLIVR
jgi:hypothetical protein